MKNKFNIGDKVSYKTVEGGLCTYFTITNIAITPFGSIKYSDNGVQDYIEESRLSLYIEPKPKVKKYLWAYQYVKQPHSSVRQSITYNFYADEFELKKDHVGYFAFIKRLDWSETEFEVEGE